MKIHNYLLNIIQTKGAVYLILLDPDKINPDKAGPFVRYCEESGVDGFLVGGSLLLNGDIEIFIKNIKKFTSLPVIIFPGSVEQVSGEADAILFLSVISGRNPEHLIGKHVIAAPLVKKKNLEAISTGYILIESGASTTSLYMSSSLPIPRDKNDIACATALAAEYLGMKFIYLEAGSGAKYSIPDEMVKAVSEYVSVPVIVGGGIKTPDEAGRKVKNGAKIIITGNFFENENNWELIKYFADAVHKKINIEV